MNIIARITLVTMILALTGYAAASEEVNRQEAVDLVPLGYVSATNLSTPDEVADALRAKAEQAGASYFRITSLNGKNNFYGTATIYQ